MKINNQAVAITDHQKAELIEWEDPGKPGEGEVIGELIVSLISPGTELERFYFGSPPYPQFSGYSAIMKVTEIGPGVNQIKTGDLLYFMGRHIRKQKVKVENTLPLPSGLSPYEAVIARLIGVSWTTLITTSARPGDRVLVLGLGPVGHLTAKLFALNGYIVTGYDPDPERRELLKGSGVAEIIDSLPVPTVNSSAEYDKLEGRYELVLECSGREQGVLDGVKLVCRGGEVVMIGLPWRRYGDVQAQALLDVIFRRYVKLRSGWEWEIPLHAGELQPHSVFGNYKTALRWLMEGKFQLEGLIRKVSPEKSSEVYRALANREIRELFVEFDWNLI
ncbi:zinc-binding dehydrogenase [Brevibacillus sp. NRS-1366]|uniref:zinc-binding dehydrogenase n=1 Tax=Brevibacillus sp. NRS-1366 TaxID=3233899 RepID=UPI003D1FE00A